MLDAAPAGTCILLYFSLYLIQSTMAPPYLFYLFIVTCTFYIKFLFTQANWPIILSQLKQGHFMVARSGTAGSPLKQQKSVR